MSEIAYTHLHLHTEYSLLDGANKIGKLAKKLKSQGVTSAAITDHGNLFGAVHFYTEALAFGLKPIIGCEMYVAHTSRFDRESQHARTRYHLILLAQNLVGYRNLVKLVSLGFMEGYYYKPRVDKEILAKYSEGIIALSACMAGEIPRLLMSDQAPRLWQIASVGSQSHRVSRAIDWLKLNYSALYVSMHP